MKQMTINKERLWNSIMELGNIGKGKQNGVTRLSLSKEDQQARDYIVDLMNEAGLEVRVDEVGNVIGKLVGLDDDLPVVMTGSHIDTVVEGGMFDGALGVLGGIETLRTIKESGIVLNHSIEVVSFTDEEGVRFGSGFIGSKAMIGEVEETHFSLIDNDGVSYKEAFEEMKLDYMNFSLARRKGENIKAYIELHIEQGRVLEMEDLSVGIVTEVQGPVWMVVDVQGQTDHAGATPMNLRKDASLAAAEMLPLIEEIAVKWEGVATVGKMEFIPGNVNIIPGTVRFSIDFRHTNKQIRDYMKNDIIKALKDVTSKRKVDFSVSVQMEVDPMKCSSNIVQEIERSFWETSLPVFKMKCGAGHDALLLGKITDFGMIFVRSKDGLSHTPYEWSSKDDCAKGTQVLCQTLFRLAR